MMVYNNIQILTGFEDNSNFVCPKDESVVRSRRLRATDLFEWRPPSPRIWTRPRRINKMIMVLIHHIVVYSVIFCIIIIIKDAFYSRCRCRYNKHSAILTYISLKKMECQGILNMFKTNFSITFIAIDNTTYFFVSFLRHK